MVQAVYIVLLLLRLKCLSHQTNKDKPRAQKCRHFCFSFDQQQLLPTCREAGKGDDPCVTFETPCDICASFTDEQMKKIQHRKRYLVLKIMNLIFWAKATGIPSLAQMLTIFLPHPPPHPPPPPTPVLSLLPSVLYLSRHQPSLFHPPQVRLYNKKIQSNLEKSLGNSLNIHLQQQMGSFQASMLEAFQLLREELTAK